MPKKHPARPAVGMSITLFAAVLSFYSIFTYSLTDPNLVLTSWQTYWLFQTWIWQTVGQSAPLQTICFTLLVTSLLTSHYLLIRHLRWPDWQRWGLLAALCISPLLISYNALSHDVFNYLFNAKMVVQYHVNPHSHVALEFAQDEWVRFMHNTHTPAPYGQGWTGFSLIPFLLGFGKFTPTWLLFRSWSVLSWCVLISGMVYLWRRQPGQTQQENRRERQKQLNLTTWQTIFFVGLHPLVLIELISNSHNDGWMMGLAVWSIALLFEARQETKNQRKAVTFTVLSALLLTASVSIKLATVLLLPVWISLLGIHWKPALGWLTKWSPQVKALPALIITYWADFACLLMFLLLLTPRSQQFHPWYLTWILVWTPFQRWKPGRRAVIALATSSLYRYVPWLWHGQQFSTAIVAQQKLVTWGLAAVIFFSLSVYHSLRRPSS